jgi:hypothetical protein
MTVVDAFLSQRYVQQTELELENFVDKLSYQLIFHEFYSAILPMQLRSQINPNMQVVSKNCPTNFGNHSIVALKNLEHFHKKNTVKEPSNRPRIKCGVFSLRGK